MATYASQNLKNSTSYETLQEHHERLQRERQAKDNEMETKKLLKKPGMQHVPDSKDTVAGLLRKFQAVEPSVQRIYKQQERMEANKAEKQEVQAETDRIRREQDALNRLATKKREVLAPPKKSIEQQNRERRADDLNRKQEKVQAQITVDRYKKVSVMLDKAKKQDTLLEQKEIDRAEMEAFKQRQLEARLLQHEKAQTMRQERSDNQANFKMVQKARYDELIDDKQTTQELERALMEDLQNQVTEMQQQQREQKMWMEEQNIERRKEIKEATIKRVGKTKTEEVSVIPVPIKYISARDQYKQIMYKERYF